MQTNAPTIHSHHRVARQMLAATDAALVSRYHLVVTVDITTINADDAREARTATYRRQQDVNLPFTKCHSAVTCSLISTFDIYIETKQKLDLHCSQSLIASARHECIVTKSIRSKKDR